MMPYLELQHHRVELLVKVLPPRLQLLCLAATPLLGLLALRHHARQFERVLFLKPA